MTNRRKFIASVGVAGTVAIAGCSNVPLIGGGGPEGAVEQYFTAANEGNAEKANEVLHPESSIYPVDEATLESNQDTELVSVEEISTAELAETDSLYGSGSKEELERAKENIKSETGADEVAFVMITAEQDGETQEQPLPVVKDGGDWMIAS